MTTTIAVAVSGGIDSLFTAHSLSSGGHRVVGLHFVTGFESDDTPSDPMACGQRRADAIAHQLAIDVHVVDLRQPFKTTVVDYFIREYESGRTPNPCMICNPTIKFGHLLNAAAAYGADRLATGHYARVSYNRHTRRYELKTGLDPRKDQAYFLARLNQDQLARVLFPLGDQTKTAVMAEAASCGLTPITKGESQDICFLPQGQYRDFLDRHRTETARPGPIDHVDGRRLGRHRGLFRYTIGQRRGIDIPADRPYYVVGLDPAANRLIVGDREALAASECTVSDTNWISPPPEAPVAADVRIRYRSPLAPATLSPGPDDTVGIQFHSPQSAIAPGQGAVFYHGDRVIGSGWIQPNQTRA